MKLEPSRPPGRATRKAGAFAAEIKHLRAEGYTFEAIREALAAAGMAVSLKTVQREAVRPQAPSIREVRTPLPCSAPELQHVAGDPTPVARQAPAGQRITGRDIAQEFMQKHPSHPLLKPQELP